MQSIAISVCMYVCLSVYLSIGLFVCPRAYLKNILTSKLLQICCTLLSVAVAVGHPPTVSQYVMYFRFCEWRHVFTWWNKWVTIKDDTYVVQFVQFGRWRYRGRSLPSLAAFCWLTVANRPLFASSCTYFSLKHHWQWCLSSVKSTYRIHSVSRQNKSWWRAVLSQLNQRWQIKL